VVVRTKTPEQSEKILTAAAQLFARHRFHEARMEDIAAAAAVGKGTLYRYFQDKDQLYGALLERAAEQITHRLCQATTRACGPRERLETVLRVILDYFDEQPQLFDLIHHAEAMHQIDAGSPWQRARDEVSRQVRQIFDEARATGAFVIRDPDLAALMLLGGLRAIILSGKPPRPADLVRRIVNTFLEGAAAPAPSRRPVGIS
jgi:AcrR family transcriptional regulator